MRCEARERWIWREVKGRRSVAKLKLARGKKKKKEATRR